MNYTKPGFAKKAIITFAFFLLGLMFVQNANAQPGGYCVPWPKDGNYQWGAYCTVQDWGYYCYIGGVKVIQVSNNSVVFERQSGIDNCYIFTGEEMSLKLGNTYRVELTGRAVYPYGYYYYNYYYNRLFIDWNQNGTFSDNVAPNFERIGNSTLSAYSINSASPGTAYSVSWTFQIPCNVVPGKTRMRLSTCAYYDNGADPCINGYDYPGYYTYNYGEMEDFVISFIPDIESTFPPNNGLIYANEAYDGSIGRLKDGVPTDFPKPSLTMGSTQPSGATLRFKITGPRPSTATVYEGLDQATNLPTINMGGYKTYTMQKSRGTYSVNGDGTFRSPNGGEYKIAASVSGAGCPGDVYQVFTVAWQNDIAVNDVVSPKGNLAPRYHKYLRNNVITVSGVVQNTGMNDVTEFMLYAYILNSSGDTIQRFSYHFDSNNNPADAALKPTEKREIVFGTMKINTVGIYRMTMKADLQSAVDQEDFNDYFPRQGDPAYTFEVAYEIQLQANKIIRPSAGEVLIGNRPILPLGEFKNVGVYDASDVPGKLNVYKLPARTLVYTNNRIVQDIPSGKYNTRQEEFDVMTIRETGTYEAELIISHEDDPLRNDDTTRLTFSVDCGLAGNYTVGAGGNFPTIDSAMNALYYKGLCGSVTFNLTDSYYKVSGRRTIDPAWDFTSHIINLGYDAQTGQTYTITWKPSAQRAVAKGSITIDLESPNGKGIAFGQSMDPANPYSLYNQYFSKPSLARKYVNNQGYITFDGGSQKSFKFRIKSGSKATATAFFLGRGSRNITIKNCVVENGTPSLAKNVWIPMTAYSPVSGFTFQPDTFVVGATTYGYSAGIVNRSTLFGTEQAALIRVDTIPNTNNKIQNNEISGFGYGIMSLGIGQLLMENEGDYKRHYNKTNEISNNTIYSVARAGIYLGYEENTVVKNNRIYNVSNTAGAVGAIIAGGDGTNMYKGYNNVGLSLTGNEISAVSSNSSASGIRVEQVQNTYPHPSKGQVHFPDIAEGTKIMNNAMWNITTTTSTGARAGIHVLTQRKTDPDWLTSLITPNVASYNSRMDKIANNTVIMSSNAGVASTGPVVGIGLQNVRSAEVKNNAVALMDIGVDANSPVYSAFFYQGIMPLDGGITTDRNAFWAPSNANASFYRFIETFPNGTNIEIGNRNDYKSLDQWRNWTKQDRNSVYGNFTQDLVYNGAEPNQKLRIKTNPMPIGSILNNRGDRLSWVTNDIDGNTRGPAGQKYDIGASEFEGRLYISDVEALTITEPAAYRAGAGLFSDAEYIMTTAPVNVKAMVRNSGNLQMTGIRMTLNIYRELPNGTYPATPEVTTTALVNIPTGESKEVSFDLADGIGTEFMPKTYGELRGTGYYIPDQFLTMAANVTPKYKLDIAIQSDQYNSNNLMSKEVRYYVRKSTLRMLVSAENSMLNLDVNSNNDQVAGKLNYDSLMKALSRVGWVADYTKDRFDLDVFDRAGWEPKAVNYDIYRTIWWSDANDKALNRYQVADLNSFYGEGNQIEKKNLIISSQDIVRSTEGTEPTFVHNVLRSTSAAPGNPMGLNGDNNGNSVLGRALHRSMSEGIRSTGWTNGVITDNYPACGLLDITTTGEGLAQPTSFYTNHSGAPSDSVAGVTNTTLNTNLVLLAVDWRHWQRADYIIRASVDYIEKNGGTVIPVELLSFDARAINNRVELNWSTASENNSDKFEIERAVKSEAGAGNFTKIGEEKAAGRSTNIRNYGPIVDQNVSNGMTYVYRLKMVDVDSKFDYSDEKEVNIGEGNWLGEARPNPSNVYAEFESGLGSDVTVVIYDINGKVMTAEVKNEGGVIRINTSSLTSGNYTVVVKAGEDTYTRKLNVVK